MRSGVRHLKSVDTYEEASSVHVRQHQSKERLIVCSYKCFGINI